VKTGETMIGGRTGPSDDILRKRIPTMAGGDAVMAAQRARRRKHIEKVMKKTATGTQRRRIENEIGETTTLDTIQVADITLGAETVKTTGI